jgi:PAS domain-containing protein
MDEQQHHEELIEGVSKEQKLILDKSPQAIYIYLDDNHKVCNKKFADLLGYESRGEWAKMDAPLADVVEKDQQMVIDAYGKASEKLVASKLEIRFKNVKTGKIIKVGMLMVPIAFEGHVFVMHFLE